MNILQNLPKYALFTIRIFSANVRKFSNFKSKIIENADKGNVIEFLTKHYYPYEPLNVALDTLKRPVALNEESEFYLTRAIASQCSCILLNDDNKIISVLLNKIETNGAYMSWLCNDPVICKIWKFYNHVHLECLVAKKFDASTFINIDVMAVDLNYVGKGLSQKMVGLLRDLAKEKKIKLITFTCTSNYSALSATKAGFIEAYKLNYVDYLVDGKQVFAPKLPHKHVQVFALSIPL